MALFAAVVPPEWLMWGYNPKKFSARFARSVLPPPTLKIVAPPLRGSNFAATATADYNYVSCFCLLTVHNGCCLSIVSASQVGTISMLS